MSELLRFVVPKTPMLISTAVKHFYNGPPRPSWDFKFHMACTLIGSFVMDIRYVTIESVQSSSVRPVPVPIGVEINESKVNNEYRYEAQVHLEKILKPYEHVLDDDWKDLKEDGIAAEWVQVPNDGWEKREIRKTILYLHGGAYYMCSKGSHRNITGRFAKQANARVFAIDYRLAPQNQFPAGLHDALAAYLYLLNPPKDAGFEPLDPKNIIIAGDSAGGGLSMALGLAIRDSGLPSCAGIICLSPWVDLTISMPSMLNNNYDYLPYPGSSFYHTESEAEINYREKAAALTAKIRKQDICPKIWHDSFDRPDGRMHMYTPNESLAIPYVSSMLAESLGDLPPLLLLAGDDERLRDEIFYLAHRAAEPTKYKGPSYNEGKFEKSPFQNPTNTTLELYQEMPHVFQMFDHVNTEVSFKRSVEFISRIMNAPNEPLPPSSYNFINSKGEVSPLGEKYKEILEWKNVGIVPGVNIVPNVQRSEVKAASRTLLTPELLMYIVLLVSIISYWM